MKLLDHEELLDAPNATAIEALSLGLKANVGDDLNRHRAEVELELEQELVMHLYNTSGEYRHGLALDPVAQKAVQLLESNDYISILQGPAEQN